MKTNWILIAAAVCVTGIAGAPSVAEACGTFIAVEGETATLDAQRVIMAYRPEENRTRVMAQIGFVGDLTAFSWIIPLPSEPSNIQAIDEKGAALFQQLDDYASPKFGISSCGGVNNGGGEESVVAPGVRVLQTGHTGTFEYVVLTGTGGSVVTNWLNAQGYAMPDGMTEVIHTYIREGSVFMALKVDLAALDLDEIDPAIAFDYEGWPGYPLRIAAPTTTDEVEIILNVIAPSGVRAPDEKVLGDQHVGWAGGEPQYLDALRRANGWVVEYRGGVDEWSGGDYGGVTTEADRRTLTLIEQVLGIPADSAPTLTRLHAIFSPDELSEDTRLTLDEDASYVSSVFQTYVCDEDWDEGGYVEVDESEYDGGCFQGSCGGSKGGSGGSRGGCSTSSSNVASPLLLLLAVWLFSRRRFDTTGPRSIR